MGRATSKGNEAKSKMKQPSDNECLHIKKHNNINSNVDAIIVHTVMPILVNALLVNYQNNNQAYKMNEWIGYNGMGCSSKYCNK